MFHFVSLKDRTNVTAVIIVHLTVFYIISLRVMLTHSITLRLDIKISNVHGRNESVGRSGVLLTSQDVQSRVELLRSRDIFISCPLRKPEVHNVYREETRLKDKFKNLKTQMI